ncbi:MAG: glutaredoxin family protein [Candidatus Peregrinibacteria bacterium]|nr:glutaredoxin family protein [Candidatus Peregrinibacteria bacterium]
MSHITIYTSPTCLFCRQLRDLLTANTHPFTEYNIIDEPERLVEMRSLTRGISAVPVIVLDKGTPDQKVLIGFESDSLEAMLSKS